jgi:hypothetical protein
VGVRQRNRGGEFWGTSGSGGEKRTVFEEGLVDGVVGLREAVREEGSEVWEAGPEVGLGCASRTRHPIAPFSVLERSPKRFLCQW